MAETTLNPKLSLPSQKPPPNPLRLKHFDDKWPRLVGIGLLALLSFPSNRLRREPFSVQVLLRMGLSVATTTVCGDGGIGGRGGIGCVGGRTQGLTAPLPLFFIPNQLFDKLQLAVILRQNILKQDRDAVFR